MTRQRFAVDVEALMVALTSRDMTQATVATQPDTDTADRLPFIVISCGNGTIVAEDANLSKVWNWTVHFMVVAESKEEASDLADELYEKVWSWDNPWNGSGTIPGVGAIAEVGDISAPSETATTVTPAGGLSQYDATFSINVRKA